MADPNHPNPGGQKPFAEFLREVPHHHGETVTLTGHVSQSDREEHFVLDLGGGQHLELPTAAVRSYKVAEEGGREVRIELDRAMVEKTSKPISSDNPKNPLQDHHSYGPYDLLPKLPFRDHVAKIPYSDSPYLAYQFPPGPDPTQFGQATGAVPFTLAAAHQAPQNALTLQGLSGQVKPIVSDRTIAYYDVHQTFKEVVKDPILDTVKEVYETLVEGGGTIQEGGGTIQEGGGFPGGGFNPGY
jgi:hypothetical protein